MPAPLIRGGELPHSKMSAAPPTRESLIALARAAAAAHALDPALVCAVVEQESAWNPWAIRYEPGFLARYVAPIFTAGKISATEAYARSFSWGLMQVMGQVAREHGFGSSIATPVSPSAPSAASSSTGFSLCSPGSPNPGLSAAASLAELCDPATGLDVGCRVLAAKLASAEGNVARALLLWNGGANHDYASAVLARTARYAAP